MSLRTKDKEIYVNKAKKYNYLNKFSGKVLGKGLETTKSFWKFIKPFLTNKGTLTDCDITIVDGKKIIWDDFELAKTFNNHYINTVKYTVVLNL